MLSNFDLLDLATTTRDDAFYYFQIAWNMAQGRFSTFDGGITQTNGYHPLWLFLITPFYWFFDKEPALFAIRAFEIMLLAGGVVLIALAAKLCRLPWLLLFAALPLLYQERGLLWGMEAAAALLMLALLFLGLALFIRNPGRWKWGLAAVCFALPWVRLEYIAISLAVTAALGLFEFPHWRRRAAGGGGWWAGLRSFHALAPLAGAGAGLLVYFGYNELVFGGIVPVSGATKAAWSQFRWELEGGYNFGESFRAARQLPLFGGELLAAVEVCLWLLPVWWLARRPARDSETGGGRLLFAFMLGGFGLAVGHLAMFGYTVLTVHPVAQGGVQWYFVPAYLLMALLVPLRCYVVLALIGRFIGPRWPSAARPLQAAVGLAAVGLLVWQTDFIYPRQPVNPPATQPRPWVHLYAGALMADRGLPEGSVLGVWDAGTIGYFTRFPVVNLDGLANSWDYFRAATGPGAAPAQRLARTGELPPAARDFGITHLANTNGFLWDGVIFETGWSWPDGRLKNRFKIRPVATEAGPEAASAFAERLAAASGQPEGGAALAVDGRLAQAFAPDCAPEELLVWVYAGGGGGGATFPATTTYHNSAGGCTAAQTLPVGAAPPVRVVRMSAGDYLAQLGRRRPPTAQGRFEVYFLAGPPGTAPQALYAKAACTEEDTQDPFFLHLFSPSDEGWTDEQRLHGFVNADFRFPGLGGQFGEWCLAAAPLYQDFPISGLRTGQWVQEENRRLWEAELAVAPQAPDARSRPGPVRPGAIRRRAIKRRLAVLR